jgi:hypothetical protein
MFLLDADGMFRQPFLLDDDAFLIDISPNRGGLDAPNLATA